MTSQADVPILRPVPARDLLDAVGVGGVARPLRHVPCVAGGESRHRERGTATPTQVPPQPPSPWRSTGTTSTETWRTSRPLPDQASRRSSRFGHRFLVGDVGRRTRRLLSPLVTPTHRVRQNGGRADITDGPG